MKMKERHGSEAVRISFIENTQAKEFLIHQSCCTHLGQRPGHSMSKYPFCKHCPQLDEALDVGSIWSLSQKEILGSCEHLLS